MKLKYSLSLLIILFSGLYVKAQHNTNSPYTMFGIGYIEQGGFGRNKGLGGAGIALPSGLSLNNMNPASYSSLDSLHFLLETGVNGIYSKFSNRSQNQDKFNSNFSYFAVGFRLNKWWANSIGLAPYSSIGYSIDSRKQIEGSTGFSNISIDGEGGLNQFYWGNSFKINKNFALGVTASYLFGTISQIEKTTISGYNGSISVEDKSRLRNLYFNYGIQYSYKLNDNVKGIIGAVYGNKTQLSQKHDITVFDNSKDTLSSDDSKKSKFSIPQYYGLGASIHFYNKLLITADYSQSDWSESNSTSPGIKFVNSNNIAFGIEYIPSFKPSATYLQVLKYRIGGYRENSYMKINGQQLTDIGVTAGIGFPVMKGRTFINLAFAAGRKGGSGTNSLISEDYFKINLNITLIDFWFARSKFD